MFQLKKLIYRSDLKFTEGLPNAYKLMCFDRNINGKKDVKFFECYHLSCVTVRETHFNVFLESKAFVILKHARSRIGIECPLIFNTLLFFNR